MAQWGREDAKANVTASSTFEKSNGAPIGTYALVGGGGGDNAHFGNTLGKRANTDQAMFGNVTMSAFVPGMAVGVFGVDVTEAQVSNHAIPHPGWNVRRAGSGYLSLAVPATQAAQKFANGETVTVSNGVTNATLLAVTNATGNIVSFTVSDAGSGWTTTDDMVAAWNHDVQWIANVQVTGSTADFTNTDYVVCSNGTVNCAANVTTNTIGGIDNSSFTITEAGLFAEAVGISNVVVTAYAANGAASNGTGASFTVKVANSALTDDITLTAGGRAGRVSWETLVAMRTLGMASDTIAANAVVGDASDDTILPDS